MTDRDIADAAIGTAQVADAAITIHDRHLIDTKPDSPRAATTSPRSDMATNVDLEAIKARAEAATPGPWVWAVYTTADGDEWAVFDLTDRALVSCRDGWRPDAEFFAAAREDVPALVAEIERLTGEPTEDEIERAARGLWVAWSAYWSTPWSDLDDEDRADMRKDARAALRAARGLS